MEIDRVLVTEENLSIIIYDHEVLLRISNFCGIIALIVGWGIFLLWFFILAISGEPYEPLMLIGFSWIGIGFVIGIIGLISLISFAIINRKKSQPKTFKSLAVLLASIPSVFIIIYLVQVSGHL